MKLLLKLLVFSLCLSAFAQDSSLEISGAAKNEIFKEASSLFSQGKYQATANELTTLESKIGRSNKEALGLIAYWKGICFNKVQNFPDAIAHFDKALGLNYAPTDIHYEYGQALFASEKLSEARLQFRESLKKKFKRAVSLYYIAYISKELGDKKKAVTFYKAINKLSEAEAMEVRQAAEMQIGDIYLDQVEKHPDAIKAVETYVIPQYKLALEVDRNSNLAPVIQDKIRGLESKYDLVLFKLRNGRPTLIPPYFARVALEYGVDSNVTFAPTEQEVAESKTKSGFVRADAMGKYTFYYKNYLSISPEFRANYTRYMNREPEIFRNDNYLLAPALRTGYEHTWLNKPATFLFDYDYNEARRDIEAEKKLEFAFRSHTLMIGERFQYFSGGESIVRLKQRIFDSYLDSSDSKSTSLVFEQIVSFPVNTLILYGSYDMTRVEDDIYDTNSLTVRGDVIFGRVRDWFTPSIGLGITRTDPINNSERGIEYLFNPSARISRTLAKNLRGNLKFDYQDYKSDDKENFAYKKHVYSFELEYVF